MLLESKTPRKQVLAESGCDRQRHQQRGENRRDVHVAERTEEATFQTFEEEQRNEHHHDDDRGEDDRTADLVARAEDHLRERSAVLLGKKAVLAKPAEHVLDVDDAVIDDFADRDGKSAQRHHVDRAATPAKHQQSDGDREWGSSPR